ncbi:sulfotransferase family 2 domain-containing protein [Pontibaca salina]|uniref:Sulfotransferase family 2 domain-containing protein n=1 Tax=Pontibaca salina TaxID=2795731 RepID=A0A934HNR0_9RHOB|nr:sulfotransferase family 2 domain-containing protein [Pontibaca salina]MBI6630376.1 sulfotransferase family 2 domain-containing protein [Pontibaca salina]
MTISADNNIHPMTNCGVTLEVDVREKWYYGALAPFSTHYRQKLKLARTPLADRIVLDHLLSTEHPKIIFAKNSKAACTSIAHAIFRLASGYQYNGRIHKESDVLTQGREHWEKNMSRLSSPLYKSVTFVRHPVDRLESAFRDFVVERRNPNHVYHMAQFRKFGYNENRSITDNLNIFLDYVEASHEISRLRTDRHWRLQVDNVGWGRFQYDYVGRVETLAKDLQSFLIMAGVEAEAAARVASIRMNTSRSTERIASNSMIYRIQKLYAEDFEAFGYD